MNQPLAGPEPDLPDKDNPPVCRDCGAIVPGWEIDQRRLGTAYRELDLAEREKQEQADAIVRTSRQVSQLRGQVKELRKQQLDSDDKATAIAHEVATYWKKLLAPRTRELKGPRLEKTIARAQAGYTLDELKLAVYGYYCRQYVVDGKRVHQGPADQRFIDLELIMRDAKHVDTGIAIAKQDGKLDIENVHDGGTLKLQRLCDCGHRRADHMRPDLVYKFLVERFGEEAGTKLWMERSEPCAHPDCDCVTYDTLKGLIDERIERSRTAPQPPPRIRAA